MAVLSLTNSTPATLPVTSVVAAVPAAELLSAPFVPLPSEDEEEDHEPVCHTVAPDAHAGVHASEVPDVVSAGFAAVSALSLSAISFFNFSNLVNAAFPEAVGVAAFSSFDSAAAPPPVACVSELASISECHTSISILFFYTSRTVYTFLGAAVVTSTADTEAAAAVTSVTLASRRRFLIRPSVCPPTFC